MTTANFLSATLFDADAEHDARGDDTPIIGTFDFEHAPRIGEQILLHFSNRLHSFRVLEVTHLGNSNEQKRAGFDYPGSAAMHLTVRQIEQPYSYGKELK